MHLVKDIAIFGIILIFSINIGNTQSFGLKDSIEVIVKLDGQKCLVHTVETKQTLYNISRLYNIPINNLLAYNNLTSDDVIYQGNKIYIPLNYKIHNNQSQFEIGTFHYKPVFYTVRPKDNLYAISHRYFQINKKELIENNNLINNNISIGQNLLIGWIALKKNYSEWTNKNAQKDKSQEKRDRVIQTKVMIASEIVEEKAPKEKLEPEKIIQTEKVDIVSVKQENGHKSDAPTKTTLENDLPNNTNTTTSKEDLKNEGELSDSLLNSDILKPEKVYINQTGIALWNKHNSDKINSFVLHPTAKNNSIIELFNPLTNRTAYAKVIGHLQSNIYASDVSIFISPKVAERLGALDERFKIQMIYYE